MVSFKRGDRIRYLFVLGTVADVDQGYVHVAMDGSDGSPADIRVKSCTHPIWSIPLSDVRLVFAESA